MSYINEPIPYQFTNEDILHDFKIYKNKKKVAKIWGISIKDINEILNNTEQRNKMVWKLIKCNLTLYKVIRSSNDGSVIIEDKVCMDKQGRSYARYEITMLKIV